jgi:hypothetical protein
VDLRATARWGEGCLLPWVGRSAWIGVDRRLFVVGLERWGGGARRQQSWLCQSGSRASAVQKRLGTAALLECERLLSLCGGGKLASRGGALGVDCGYRRLFVVGLERWGGGARRQQSWLSQSGSRASALQKRLGTAALLECERLLSLCGGGKLASWGGALGVDCGYRGLFVVGLDTLGWWCATPAGLALPKRQQGFRSPKASWYRRASRVRISPVLRA